MKDYIISGTMNKATRCHPDPHPKIVPGADLDPEDKNCKRQPNRRRTK